MIRHFIFLLSASIVSTCVGSFGLAGSGEITGFRYVTCDAGKCISVESPKAWVSQSNGSFVASGDIGSKFDQATIKLIDAGHVTHEFRGTEIVSQPEIDAMTIESDSSVILIGVKNSSVEVIEKRGRQ